MVQGDRLVHRATNVVAPRSVVVRGVRPSLSSRADRAWPCHRVDAVGPAGCGRFRELSDQSRYGFDDARGRIWRCCLLGRSPQSACAQMWFGWDEFGEDEASLMSTA